MSLTLTKITEALLGYPKKEVHYKVTDTSIPVAGESIAAADLTLDSIDYISCTAVEIAGSVNTQTLIPKYDPASGKIFWFGQADDTSTTVAKPFAIIPGNIASAQVFYLKAVGNDVNN